MSKEYFIWLKFYYAFKSDILLHIKFVDDLLPQEIKKKKKIFPMKAIEWCFWLRIISEWEEKETYRKIHTHDYAAW